MNAIVESASQVPASPATPARLLEIAVEKGADLDQLSKLMDLQERWEANEARKAFVVAMSEFRADAPSLVKQSEGYGYNYSSLDYITDRVNPVLSKHGLSFGWVTEQGERIIVHCDVTHIQGHNQRVSLSGAPDETGGKNDIQAIGSTVSYLQRYTMLSALGLSTGGQDDDARSASDDYERINAEQLSGLNKQLDKYHVREKFTQWLADKDERYADLANIRAANYGVCIKKINALMKESQSADTQS